MIKSEQINPELKTENFEIIKTTNWRGEEIREKIKNYDTIKY